MTRFTRLDDYLPDPVARLAAAAEPDQQLTWRESFAEILADIRAAPVSHALVAVATIIAWTLLLVAPLLVADWLS